jgi:hypothetical protein
MLNHTPGGQKAHVLNGGYNGQVGLARSFAVVPGDVIRAKVYAKYLSSPGAAGNLLNFASAILSAFSITAPPPQEGITAYDALNSFGSWIAGGNRDDDDAKPKGFINILVFNKDYELMDFAYKQLDANSKDTAPHELLSIESQPAISIEPALPNPQV